VEYAGFDLFFFTLVTGPRRSLSLKLSDTKVYEPQIRAAGHPRGAEARAVAGQRPFDHQWCAQPPTLTVGPICDPQISNLPCQQALEGLLQLKKCPFLVKYKLLARIANWSNLEGWRQGRVFNLNIPLAI